jgi:hypothetical protein
VASMIYAIEQSFPCKRLSVSKDGQFLDTPGPIPWVPGISLFHASFIVCGICFPAVATSS